MNSPLIIMLEKVANALTQDLRQEMVFTRREDSEIRFRE